MITQATDRQTRRPRTRVVGACPICARGDARPFLTTPDRMHGVPGDYPYRRCRVCGTVFQDPRVVDQELGLLYPGGYYTRSSTASSEPGSVLDPEGTGLRGRVRSEVQRAVAPEGSGAGVPAWGRLGAMSRFLRERAFHDLVFDEMLPWRTPPGRALDVGCGNGDILARLEAVGWAGHGLEVDPGAAEVARGRVRGTVLVGDVMSLDPGRSGRFDLITLSHVFEHLPDPSGALRTLSELLSRGGRLVLVYPNPESLGALTFGPHWFAWDAPRHLVLPPVRATLELCRSVGLRSRGWRTVARWGADHCMQSRAYRRGEGLQAGQPGPVDRAFGAMERALMTLGAEVGEEIIMVLEQAR